MPNLESQIKFAIGDYNDMGVKPNEDQIADHEIFQNRSVRKSTIMRTAREMGRMGVGVVRVNGCYELIPQSFKTRGLEEFLK